MLYQVWWLLRKSISTHWMRLWTKTVRQVRWATFTSETRMEFIRKPSQKKIKTSFHQLVLATTTIIHFSYLYWLLINLDFFACCAFRYLKKIGITLASVTSDLYNTYHNYFFFFFFLFFISSSSAISASNSPRFWEPFTYPCAAHLDNFIHYNISNVCDMIQYETMLFEHQYFSS